MDPTETLVVFSAPVRFSKYKFYFEYLIFLSFTCSGGANLGSTLAVPSAK